MKIFKKVLVGLLIILVIIQFFQPTKNIAAENGNHIYATFTTSAEVKTILTKACLDCHSNNTNYPWYANIQPVAWWLNDHVVDGKKQINFSEYGTYKLRKQFHKIEEVIDEVKAGEMPLNSYTWVHRNAQLSAEEKLVLISWAQNILDTMKTKYPIDSLIKKK